MTQEEKELLLKDLSARWMTTLKCAPNTKNSIVAYCTIDGIKKDIKGGSFIELTDRDSDGNALASTSTNEFNMVKPYLRPMSSMTEEEEMFYNIKYPYIKNYEQQDWLNAHHFDYRGLIEKGLALKAPKGMYK